MGKVLEGMLSVFAEFDNNMRAERCKGGMMERVKQGVWVWEAPLGYYRPYKGSNLFPDQATAPFIRLMFEEYAKGCYTFKSLGNYLYERGLTSRHGKRLTPQIIEKMLKNFLYCGRIRVWGLDVKGDFESIVSEDLFLKCQKGYRDHILELITLLIIRFSRCVDSLFVLHVKSHSQVVLLKESTLITTTSFKTVYRPSS
jgi:site-specific DNA recombinase